MVSILVVCPPPQINKLNQFLELVPRRDVLTDDLHLNV